MLGLSCGAYAEPLHKARRPMLTAEQGLCPGPSGACPLSLAGRGHGAFLPFSIYTVPGRRPDASRRGPRASYPACLLDDQPRSSWPIQHADRSILRSPRQPEFREWEDNRNQAQPSRLQMRSKRWAYSAEAAGAKTKEHAHQPDKDGPKAQGEQSAKEGGRNDRRKRLPNPDPKPKPDPESEYQGASKEAIGSAEAADPQRPEVRQDGSEGDDDDSNSQKEQEEEEGNLQQDDDSKGKEDKYGKKKNDDNSKVQEDKNSKNEDGERKVTKGKDPKENNSKVEEDNTKDDDDGKATKGKNPKEKENQDEYGKVNVATAGSQQQSTQTQGNIPTVYMQPFTPHQLRDLEKVFYVNPSPSYAFRNDLARRLNVAEGRIKVWFKNRRARLRRMRGLPPNRSSPGSQNIPVVITLGRNCRVSVVPQPGQPGQPWMRPNETPLAAVPAQHLQVPPAPVYSPACPPPYSMMPPPPASYVLAPPSAMAPMSPLLAPPMQSPVPRVPMYVSQYPPPPPSGPTWFPNVPGPNYYSFQ